MTRSHITIDALTDRRAPLEMDSATFRALGHELVDQLGARLERVPLGPITRAESPDTVRRAGRTELALPASGADAAILLREATDLLFEHSLLNGHPRFFGYITSSPAPIGMLADLLASAVNQNVGAWALSPLASAIEGQVVRWIAELTGYASTAGGLLVSGGNMANFVCLLAARAEHAPWVRTEGLAGARPRLLIYASTETHTWLQKAADMSGLGTDAIRWVPTGAAGRMDPDALQHIVEEDRRAGHQPFFVVGTAGTTSTGAVDPLDELALICREQGLWFHVDGAYGAFAAHLPGAPGELDALGAADSLAVDPHKWLYAPLEAGCVLVKDGTKLRNAFTYRPAYYHFDVDAVNYFEYGPQNSRGFRALKVWLALQHVGRDACRGMIAQDMALARHLHGLLTDHGEFEAGTCQLSITTFRYVPLDLTGQAGAAPVEAYLNRLNQHLLSAIETSGELFVSSAVVDDRFLLRACIVNFHTRLQDVEAVPRIVARMGRAVDAVLRPQPVVS